MNDSDTGTPAVTVRHDRDERRFVAVIDGEDTDAVLRYRMADTGTVDYFSTFTPPSLRGRGLARVVVTEALEYALANDLRVIPTCPYVAKIVDAEPKYRALRA